MNNLQFDFTVDKAAKTVYITREFDAKLSLVWDAFTKKELLDQWWAPKPYQAKTKTLDFREGGVWLYAMVGPDGSAQWCRADYQSVDPMKSYSARDGFCDEEGTLVSDFPRSFWTNSFHEKDTNTLVHIVIQYDTLEDLEKYMELGFKEGFTMGLENLDALLKE